MGNSKKKNNRATRVKSVSHEWSMRTLKKGKMVSLEERLKGFDAEYILQLCRDYLGGPWQDLPMEKFKYKPIT